MDLLHLLPSARDNFVTVVEMVQNIGLIRWLCNIFNHWKGYGNDISGQSLVVHSISEVLLK